eukprot:1112870-Pelagomonas_calceolata.AAC.4
MERGSSPLVKSNASDEVQALQQSLRGAQARVAHLKSAECLQREQVCAVSQPEKRTIKLASPFISDTWSTWMHGQVRPQLTVATLLTCSTSSQLVEITAHLQDAIGLIDQLAKQDCLSADPFLLPVSVSLQVLGHRLSRFDTFDIGIENDNICHSQVLEPGASNNPPDPH